MSNTDANKCTLCGRRWTDPDYPHGVEGLERVGGVGWVPECFAAPGTEGVRAVHWSGTLPAEEMQKIAAVGLRLAREQLAAEGLPGRSQDRRNAVERGWDQ